MRAEARSTSHCDIELASAVPAVKQPSLPCCSLVVGSSTPISCVLDKGADVSIVSNTFMCAAGHESGESPDVKLTAANGEELHTFGEVELPVQMAGQSVLSSPV